MKKLLVLVLSLGLVVGNVYAWKANFNYGVDTYEKWDNILIVNSLGDETVESKFNYKGDKLGYNDFIPENAFKNNLYNEGYSVVYDYNNTNLDLTSVGYMGRLGNPRSYDEDYVLTSEWEKYSSQGQDVRINDNTSNITTNKKNIVKNKQKITNVDNKHTSWNNAQDLTLDNHDSRISNNSNRINDLDNRVSKLEETQVIVGGSVRLHDSKKWSVHAFGDYSTNRTKFDRVGVRFTYKLGKSYEEKLIAEQNQRLEKLEKALAINNNQDKVKQIKTEKTKNGWKVNVDSSPSFSVKKEW